VQFARRQTFYFKYTNKLLNHVPLCHVYNTQIITDHPPSGVVYDFNRVCPSVCLSVSHTITFESLDVGSPFLHIRIRYTARRYAKRYGSTSYMKVIGSRSTSREQKGRKRLCLQRSTSVGNFHRYSPDGATDHESRVVRLRQVCISNNNDKQMENNNRFNFIESDVVYTNNNKTLIRR